MSGAAPGAAGLDRAARIAARAEALSAGVARAFSILAALAVAGIVCLLLFSAAQRYLLTRPVPFTEELAAYLFICCAFFSIMDGLVQGRHIRLLPLWQRLPRAWQGWTMVLGHLASVAVLWILIQQTWNFAWFSFELGARSPMARLPEWPWMMVIPGSLALLSLAILARAAGDAVRTLRGERLAEAIPFGERP